MVDELAAVGHAFGRELAKVISQHGVKTKAENKEKWRVVLRDLAARSKVLLKGVKETLLRYTGPGINPEDKLWDQERRWLWHAFDHICSQLLLSFWLSECVDEVMPRLRLPSV